MVAKAKGRLQAAMFWSAEHTHLMASAKQQALYDVCVQLIKTWPLTTIPWQKLWYLARNYTRFFKAFYFCHSFFSFIFVQPKVKKIPVWSTLTSDRLCARFFGLGKVFKTAQPVSICRLIWRRLACGLAMYQFGLYKLVKALLSWTLSQVRKILSSASLLVDVDPTKNQLRSIFCTVPYNTEGQKLVVHIH